MSVKIMGLVWDLSNTEIDREEKYVLLAYADHADHKGYNIFPSVLTIAEKTGYSERAVQTITRSLETKGYMVADGHGPKGTNKWRIPLDSGGAKIAPLKNLQGAENAEGGAEPTGEGGADFAPEPSLTGNEPSNGSGLSEKELAQANAMVDAQIAASRKRTYQNREKMPEPYLCFADTYHELTRQEPTKRVFNDWMLTFQEWVSEGLTVDHIRAAYAYANRPEGGFLVARPGSLTNTAVAMKTKQLAAPAREPIDKFASLVQMMDQENGNGNH